MTLVPAIFVFVIVFLSFSKKTLMAKEEPSKTPNATQGLSADTLLKYRVLNGLEDKMYDFDSPLARGVRLK